jgi:hypothetical protein
MPDTVVRKYSCVLDVNQPIEAKIVIRMFLPDTHHRDVRFAKFNVILARLASFCQISGAPFFSFGFVPPNASAAFALLCSAKIL